MLGSKASIFWGITIFFPDAAILMRGSILKNCWMVLMPESFLS